MNSLRLLTAAALAACLAAASGARANQVVILATGNRLEVESALPNASGGYHLKLVGGGELVLPGSTVRRISNAAADMPRETAAMIVTGSGFRPGTASQAAGEQASSIPAGLPPGTVREGPGKLTLRGNALRAPGLAEAGFVDSIAPSGGPVDLASPASQSVAAMARPKNVGIGSFTRGSFKRVAGSGGMAMGRQPNAPGADPGRIPSMPRVGR